MSSTVYVVNAKVPETRNRADSRVPFQKFYVVSPDVSKDQMRRLAPYALVVPLTEGYRGVLTERQVPFDECLKQGYKVVVPVHMRRAKATESDPADAKLLAPAYISNRLWWLSGARNLPQFLPEDTAMTTPAGVIEPVCLACDQHLQHMCGECVLGSVDCMNHIRVRFTPVDEPAETPDSPESLEEVKHG